MEDKRAGWKECELCDNSEFRPGAVCELPGSQPGAPGGELDVNAEELVKSLTEQIMGQLSG